jgi:carbon storage regulator
MLVLSRKPNQTIHIGDDIVVVLLDVRGNRVCLGIDAPAQVAIRRGELEPHAQIAVRDDQAETPQVPELSTL